MSVDVLTVRRDGEEVDLHDLQHGFGPSGRMQCFRRKTLRCPFRNLPPQSGHGRSRICNGTGPQRSIEEYNGVWNLGGRPMWEEIPRMREVQRRSRVSTFATEKGLPRRHSSWLMTQNRMTNRIRSPFRFSLALCPPRRCASSTRDLA